MKKTALVSMAVSLGLASLSVYAARPASTHPDLAVSCTCDWSTSPGTCTVSWSDVHARSYRDGIALSANWQDASGVAMSTTGTMDLSGAWTCAGGACSASGSFKVPDYPADATVAVEGRVLGYSNDVAGVASQYFAGGKAACNVPPPPSGDTLAPPTLINPGTQY